METTFTHCRKLYGLVWFFAFLCSPGVSFAQVSMGSLISTYTQDFNELPAEVGEYQLGINAFLPDGWSVQRSIAGDVIVANNGSFNKGDLYSYGNTSSTDRALGAVTATKSGEFTYNVLLHNTSGRTITALDIAYVGEQWRSGSINTDVQRISFTYAIAEYASSFNLSTKSNTPGWTHVSSMQFNSPVNKSTAGHVNGNLDQNRKQFSYTLPEVIPDGHYVMLRWYDPDEPEQDHGLAIDDVKVTWQFEQDYIPLPVELTHFSAKAVNKAVELVWATASEQNNSYFEVERSAHADSFEQLAVVNGQGTTSLQSNYTFTDKKPMQGVSYYRLKQVDEDGTHSYSKVVVVRAEASGTKLVAYPTIATHDLRIELPKQQPRYLLAVYDKFGSRVLQLHLTSDQLHTLQVSHLRQGSYVLVAVDELGEQHTTRFLKY